MKWLAKNWVGVIISMIVALFVFWAVGYFANALYGAKFELNSCWAGVAAVSTGAVAGLGKYWADSKHNSKPEEMPHE